MRHSGADVICCTGVACIGKSNVSDLFIDPVVSQLVELELSLSNFLQLCKIIFVGSDISNVEIGNFYAIIYGAR